MARSEVNQLFDAATAFRAPGLAAVTADTTLGVFKLDWLKDVRPSSQRNKLGGEEYKVVVVVETIATAAADEIYTFNVDVGPAGAANTRVASMTVKAAGQYVLTIDAGNIEKASVSREEMALKLDVAGVAPSIKFTAWVV